VPARATSPPQAIDINQNHVIFNILQAFNYFNADA